MRIRQTVQEKNHTVAVFRNNLNGRILSAERITLYRCKTAHEEPTNQHYRIKLQRESVASGFAVSCVYVCVYAGV